MVEILIRGGQVVTPAGVGNRETVIQGEKILMVSEPGAVDQEATKVIDASGWGPSISLHLQGVPYDPVGRHPFTEGRYGTR